MIIFQHESPISVSGRAFIAVARIKLTRHARNGALIFTGDKRPIAIICRGEGGEEIFDIDGRQIDADGLQALIASHYASD